MIRKLANTKKINCIVLNGISSKNESFKSPIVFAKMIRHYLYNILHICSSESFLQTLNYLFYFN